MSDAIADHAITAFAGSSQLTANDNWAASADASLLENVASRVGAFPLPRQSLDAALLRDLAAGGYTVQVNGAQNTTGIALKEIYDAGGAGTARLVNVSARSQVGTGAGVLIAGFVVAEGTRAVLIRGIGPSLAGFGVPGALSDAQLKIFRGAELVAENNDWGFGPARATIEAQAQAVGAFPLDAASKDAALLLTLPAGSYTVQVAGTASATGVGLIEIYEVVGWPP